MSHLSYVSELPTQEIDRPKCPECGTLMWLARIEPYDSTHEKRLFECPACNIAVEAINKFR
jgi:hypothetical protein